MKKSIKTIWTDLESEAYQHDRPGYMKRLVKDGTKCIVHLAVKMPQKRRALIIELSRESIPLPETIPASRGFLIAVEITGEELNREAASLILTSSGSEYNEVFSSIAEDLIGVIELETTEQGIINNLLSRLTLWQHFFEKHGAEGLSIEAQKGLYGELYFIERVLMPNDFSDRQILSMWTGPEKRQHDFQTASFSVEVKVSSLKQHQKMTISSEQQLDESLTNNLFVFYLSVAVQENHPETLPSIIARLRSALSDESAVSRFNSVLLSLGYIDGHAGLYDATGYKIRENRIFHIHGGFPRITESDLRDGVGDVRYSIIVSDCLDYELSEKAFINQLNGPKDE